MGEERRIDPVAEGLSWPEAPRWRDGALWVSDVHHFRLVRIPDGGALSVVTPFPGRPSGSGFLPDGRLLLAGALDKKLWRVGLDGAASAAADLSGLARGLLNDMVVDGTGRAWVGDTGYDLASGAPAAPGTVFLVDAEGRARPVAEDIAFPNGMAISPDGGTLYLSETMGKRILAFDIAPDGTLAHKRVHAELDAEPDGLCLDAEGCLWVPLVFKGEFRRVAPGGAVVDRIAFPGRNAIACVFGGDDRRTLYLTLCLADRSNPAKPVLQGSIVKTRTDIPGAGLP